MKLGLIVRADDRGLGVQSWEAYRHLNPDRTLLIDMGDIARDWETYPDRFPEATIVRYDTRNLPEQPVKEWLDGLDVVLTFETFYEWRIIDWAAELGVATVCQSNPELHHRSPKERQPTQWWAPTPWRLEHLPPSTVVVPVPVALERFTGGGIASKPNGRTGPDSSSNRLRVLHVAGRRAVYDRNGTEIVSLACQYVQEAVDVVITTQDAYQPDVRLRGPGMRAQVRAGNIENYWDLYAGFDVLLMPRRYGGLCLPSQEAMAAGLGVIMPGCSPNESWPILPLPVADWSRARMPGGEIDLAAVSPRKVAEALDCLAVDRLRLAMLKDASRTWAIEHSWEALAPLYRRRLEDACNRCP